MTYLQLIGILAALYIWALAFAANKVDERRRVLYLVIGTGTLLFSQFFPGLTDGDTITLMTFAERGLITDWHAPLLALLYSHLVLPVYEGPLLIFITVTLLFWFGFYNLIGSTIPPSTWRYSIVLSIFLYPPTFCVMGQVSKHSVFMACCVFAGGMLFVKLPKYVDIMRAPLAWLALLLATNTRLESLVVVAPFVGLWVSYYEKSWGKVLRLILLVLGSIVLMNVAINTAIITKYIYPQQQIYDQDLGGISFIKGSLMFPPDSLVDGASNERFRECFNYRSRDSILVNTVIYTDDSRIVSHLKSYWIQRSTGNIDAYIESRAITYGYYLGLYEYSDKSGFDFIMSQEQERHPTPRFIVSSSPLTLLVDLVYCQTRAGPLCRPIMILAIGVIVFLYLIFKPVNQITYKVILCFWSSALLHMGIYFFVTPGLYFRYAHWPFFAMSLALGLCIAAPSRTLEKHQPGE